MRRCAGELRESLSRQDVSRKEAPEPLVVEFADEGSHGSGIARVADEVRESVVHASAEFPPGNGRVFEGPLPSIPHLDGGR